MAYRKTPFQARIEVDPKGATADLVTLYDRCEASQKAVATKLGVAEQTLLRWIKGLDAKGTGIVKKLDAVKEKHAKAGHPTRPAQGWRRKPEEKVEA